MSSLDRSPSRSTSDSAAPCEFSWRAIEPFSCYSHLCGVLLAIAALVALIVTSEGAPRIVGFSIYGASLILLYLASTLYHWLALSPEQREWLNRCDHVAIFL
ncbi:MAG: hemolysin III family protein, partial [Candidatus Binatia bacterium]